jgi:hypothetical protein
MPPGGPAPASPTRRSACPFPVAWPGGLPWPWNRGTVDAVACQQAARGKRQSQRSRPWIRPAGHRSARVPGWLVGRLRLGSGMPSTVRPGPSTLGVVGERGSRHESCSQLAPGSAVRRENQVHSGGVVPPLGPRPLPTLGVDRLGRADLAQQLVRAASSSRASSSSQVASSNRSTSRLAPSLSSTARWRLLPGRVPMTAWLAAWGSAAATQ